MHEEIVHLLQELGEKKINTQWSWINKIKMENIIKVIYLKYLYSVQKFDLMDIK